MNKINNKKHKLMILNLKIKKMNSYNNFIGNKWINNKMMSKIQKYNKNNIKKRYMMYLYNYYKLKLKV